MDSRQQQAIQEQVRNYFKETDNITFSKVVDAFVFLNSHPGIGKIVDKFLRDVGIQEAYVNYISDIKRAENKDFYFKRGSASQTDLIEQIKNGFLVESFHRFHKFAPLHDKMKRNYDKLAKDVTALNEAIDKIMDAGNVERLDEGMDMLKEHYFEQKKNENRANHTAKKKR